MSEPSNSVPSIWHIPYYEELKNIALTLLGINYGLGYIGWSIYAFTQKLGGVSALDSQYVIAGIVPTILVVGMYILYNSNKNRKNWTNKKLDRHSKGIKRFIRILLLNPHLIEISLFAIVLLSMKNGVFHGVFVTIVLLVLILILSYAYSFLPLDDYQNFKVIKNEPKSALLQRLRIYKLQLSQKRSNNQFFLAVLFTLLILFIWNNKIFPNIPQELGGARPKECILISDKNIFDLDTNKYNKSSKFYHSGKVTVYYVNSTVIIYKDVEPRLNSEINEIANINGNGYGFNHYNTIKEISRGNVQNII